MQTKLWASNVTVCWIMKGKDHNYHIMHNIKWDKSFNNSMQFHHNLMEMIWFNSFITHVIVRTSAIFNIELYAWKVSGMNNPQHLNCTSCRQLPTN
eukprot:scaffold134813_cov21-Prasinocladus_malaysianus.AAC.1